MTETNYQIRYIFGTEITLLPFPFMVNESAKLHIPHTIIVPNNNQRLPQRSNMKFNMNEAGNSVAEALHYILFVK